MGASGWHVRVSYRDDIDAALQEARWDAYHQGRYYLAPPNELALSMTEEEYVAHGVREFLTMVPGGLSDLPGLPPELEGLEYEGDEYRELWRAAQIVVTGPDSLLDSQPYSGTHCVIDMTHVASMPEDFAAAPASEEFLQKTFGTLWPGAATIEASIQTHDVVGFARWQGMYLIGYSGEAPEAIFFVGFSGD